MMVIFIIVMLITLYGLTGGINMRTITQMLILKRRLKNLKQKKRRCNTAAQLKVINEKIAKCNYDIAREKEKGGYING